MSTSPSLLGCAVSSERWPQPPQRVALCHVPDGLRSTCRSDPHLLSRSRWHEWLLLLVNLLDFSWVPTLERKKKTRAAQRSVLPGSHLSCRKSCGFHREPEGTSTWSCRSFPLGHFAVPKAVGSSHEDWSPSMHPSPGGSQAQSHILCRPRPDLCPVVVGVTAQPPAAF